MPLKAYVVATVVVALWSVNLVLVRWSADTLPPLLMTTLRFAVAAAVLLPFARLRRRDLPVLLAVSLSFGTLHFGFMFLGLGMSDVGAGALILQTGAPMSILMAALVFRERPGPAGWAAVALALAGLAVLSWGGAGPAPLAVVLLLVSAAGWAATNMIMRAARDISSIALMAGSSLLGLPQTLLLSWLFEPWTPALLVSDGVWRGWVAVLYSGIVASAIAHGLWSTLLKRYPVSKVVPVSLLNPVFAMLLGALVLGEALTLTGLLGGALILSSVAAPMLHRGVPWRKAAHAP